MIKNYSKIKIGQCINKYNRLYLMFEGGNLD